MKLYAIKSQKELDMVMDIWYNRAIKLRDAWQNSTDYDYIAKAFRLFLAMCIIIRMLTQIYIKISQPKNNHLKNGDVVAKLNKK